MKKRILSLLLTLCLVCSLLPGVALAVNESFTYEVPGTNIVLTYQVNANDNVIITDCNSDASGALEIPTNIEGKDVISIGRSSFDGCSSLTRVTIPDTVTSIGDDAFSSCRSLISIIIPDSVTSIGDGSFIGCLNLASITIPDSVTTIGNYAFANCSSLISITIPDSVTFIGRGAFSNCSKLTNVKLSETLTTIKSGTFENCTALSSIIIPASVKSIEDFGTITIGEGAFGGCSSLASVTLSNGITTIGEQAFYGCTSLDNITIPTSVTFIGKNAFRNCTTLTSITIPDSVTSIGIYTFTNCSSLISVTIPDSVTSISGSAFSGCSKLESITIPDSVTSIGNYSFYDCGKLTSITIPSSVTTIGENALGYISGNEKLNGFAINGSCGSAAETYATENGFTFNKTHDITTIPAVAPTCTEPGLTAGGKCAGCGEIITAQTEIPPLGHDFTGTYLTDETGHWHKCSRCNAVDTKAAHTYNTTNCGEAANCTICGYTKAAGTHTWNAGEVITAPTCTTTGTLKYTCTSCGETKEETIPVSNHTPGDTWASDGAGHWHNCTVCNQKVDSASHAFGSWTTTKAATATEAGSRERACTVCGYKQTETIPATGGGSGSGGGSIGGGGSVVAPPAEEKKDEEQTTNTAVYNDVPANAWYNDAVAFVTEKGLMSGTGTSTFAPGANLTRAMLAQILYNNEDKPTTSGNAFTDVQSGAWYADAITWATQKGIVSGYGNGQFGPDDNITREQLAVILWRYAGQPTSNASLNSFTDIDKASNYALTALQWAVEKGIISGKGNGTLAPTGNATRAEVAQMLMNYFK